MASLVIEDTISESFSITNWLECFVCKDEITVPSMACAQRAQRRRKRRAPRDNVPPATSAKCPFRPQIAVQCTALPRAPRFAPGQGGRVVTVAVKVKHSYTRCIRRVQKGSRTVRNWFQISSGTHFTKSRGSDYWAATPGDGGFPVPGWRGGPRRCRHLSVHAAGPSGPRPREPGRLRGASASTPSVSHSTCPRFFLG